MKNPPIVIAKGKGWDASAWSEQKPALDKAVKKAETALRTQSITYNELKNGLVERNDPKTNEFRVGGSYGPEDFVVYEDNRKQGPFNWRDVALLSANIFHEVVHCARSEQYSDGSILELAASEGLAYVAEETYRQRSHPHGFIGKYLFYDIPTPLRWHEEFKEVMSLDCDTDDANLWLYNRPYGLGFLRKADYIGIQLVTDQVERGRSIPDLMRQPAGDVLGL